MDPGAILSPTPLATPHTYQPPCPASRAQASRACPATSGPRPRAVLRSRPPGLPERLSQSTPTPSSAPTRLPAGLGRLRPSSNPFRPFGRPVIPLTRGHTLKGIRERGGGEPLITLARGGAPEARLGRGVNTFDCERENL